MKWEPVFSNLSLKTFTNNVITDSIVGDSDNTKALKRIIKRV